MNMDRPESGLERMGVVCGVLLCASLAAAHEHWIEADCFYPEVGQTVAVHVCSGHYFPKSSFALQDKVLEGVSREGPDRQTVALETVAADTQRTGGLTAQPAGVHMLRFSLKRPRAQTPSYEGTAIVVVGDQSDSTNRYAVGVGLELVPEQPVSALRVGDNVALTVRLDGKRMASSVAVSVAGGKTSLLTTDPERPAVLKLRQNGRYLATTSYEGRGASLVFEVGGRGSEDGGRGTEVGGRRSEDGGRRSEDGRQ